MESCDFRPHIRSISISRYFDSFSLIIIIIIIIVIIITTQNHRPIAFLIQSY